MESAPLISVLVTAYNRERFLPEAIDSVLESTFGDFEIVIVDDCSKDGTSEIARAFEKRDRRIRVFQNEQNLGDYANRNQAAGYARGRYIKYLDSDDKLLKQALEVMAESMQRYPEAAVGLAAPNNWSRPIPDLLSPEQAFCEHYLHDIEVFNSSPTMTIMDRNAFRSVGGFSGKRFVGDFELWHSMAARYPSVVIDPDLTWRREHDEQEDRFMKDNSAFYAPYLEVSLRHLVSPACPLNDADRRSAIKKVKRRGARHILYPFLHGKPGVGWLRYKRYQLSVLDVLGNVV